MKIGGQPSSGVKIDGTPLKPFRFAARRERGGARRYEGEEYQSSKKKGSCRRGDAMRVRIPL